MTGHVFISHGSEDSEEANALAAFIEGKGVKAWIAPRDVRPGQDYSEQLQGAIETCTAFVVLVTDKANRSPYVRAETEMAFSTSKPIFPVRMSDIQPAAGLAFFLKIRHWTDAFGSGREAGLARLARELQTHAGVPVDEPPPSTVPPIAAPAAVPVPPPQPQSVMAAPLSPAPAPQPTMAAPPVQPPKAPADESLLMAAIGPNSNYYFERWRQMDAKGSSISWNWPACLVNLFWFAYRKMWLPFVGLLVVSIAISVIASATAAPGKVTLMLSIALSFVTGAFGNHFYRRHVQKLIAETSSLPRQGQIEALQARGGVSKVAVYVLLGITVLLTLLSVLGAMAQVQQQDMNSFSPAPQNGFAPVEPDAPVGEKPPLVDDGVQY